PGTLRGDGCALALEAGRDGAAGAASCQQALADVGLGAEITVDLVGREAKLGCLSLARARPGAGYGIFDLVTAIDFGQRLSAALEQAVLVRRVRRATHQRDELLATVSHDLRNPLAAILAGTHGLLAAPGATPPSPSTSRTRIEAIRRSAQRMTRLADDLLAMSEI